MVHFFKSPLFYFFSFMAGFFIYTNSTSNIVKYDLILEKIDADKTNDLMRWFHFSREKRIFGETIYTVTTISVSVMQVRIILWIMVSDKSI